MHDQSKIIPLEGQSYQIRKLPADVGSFILMQLIGGISRAAANAPEPSPSPDGAPKVEVSNEDRVRAMVFLVFSGSGMNFESFQFIQKHCIRAVSRMEVHAGQELPMPLVNDAGQWAEANHLPALSSNPALVMKLTTEVLVYNLADFFESGTPVLSPPTAS